MTALRFLTILPIPWLRAEQSCHFTHSVKFFPLVGVMIGLAGSLLASFLFFVPYPLLCCAILLYLSLISGFLHLDGLSDTADGFFSHRSKEEILIIMRDSRSGAMGVISLIFLLLIKFTALLSLPPDHLNSSIIFLPLAGRVAIVITMASLTYAREEPGLGKLFHGNHPKRNVLTGLALLMVMGVFIDFRSAVLVLFSLGVVTFLFAMVCKRLIAGYTGDTLGAVCELSETAAAVTLAVFLTQQ